MISQRQIFMNNLGLPSSKPLALKIDHAEGIYMYGKQGRKYIDLVSGVSVSNLGHNHPVIISAIEKQIRNHTHLMVYGEIIQSPQVNLAKKLASILPDALNCTYFVNSGSEAIEGAMKLAKRFTGRPEIVSFKNAYHGGTHGALSILGNENLKYAFRPLLPSIRQLEFNDTDQLNQITENTACVFAEPIQAEAGIILPQNDFLKILQKRCKETGALLVFDEIQMGMGRTGKLFCFEHYDVIPDILCLAKAFGGGMPLGAFISSSEIMSTLTHHPELGHITTFGGHPVSCAAGYAALSILTGSNIIKEAVSKGNKFRESLLKHPVVKSIRQKGLMLGIDLESKLKVAKLLKVFLDNGIIVDRFLFNDNSFRIAPPLTITNDETDMVCEKVISCFDKL